MIQPDKQPGLGDMETSSFLDLLRLNKIEVRASDGKLHVSAASGVLTDELKEQLRSRKLELLTLLDEPKVSGDGKQGSDLDPVDLKYWKSQLSKPPGFLELPFSRPRPVDPLFASGCMPLRIAQSLEDGLRRVASTEKVSLQVVFLAAYATLLYRYTNHEDIFIGLLGASQQKTLSNSLQLVAGNLVVIRTRPQMSLTFRELLQLVHATVKEASLHDGIAFNDLVTHLFQRHDPRDGSFLPTLVAFSEDDPALMQSTRQRITASTKVDLALHIFNYDSSLSGDFEYRADLFSAESIEQFAESFVALLESLAENPAIGIAEASLLSTALRQRMLIEWNQTELGIPGDALIHTMFEQQVALAPDAIAVIDGKNETTYRQINERANRLAHLLLHRGLEPEECVGVCMTRSSSLIVALLAILKAGGAYLPLDPAYPTHRLAAMLGDSRARTVISEAAVSERLPAGEHQVMLLEEASAAMEQMPLADPELVMQPNRLAYVIYTSGSTGQPKGVAVEHHSTVSLLHWGKITHSAKELERVLAATSICFDLSVYEIFLPLSFGYTVVLAKDATELAQVGTAASVTLINTVPSAIAALVALRGIPASVRCINLAGEPLSASLVRKIEEQAPGVRVMDLYGPTETTTYSTFAQRRGSEPATIGRPIANTRIFVLDSRLQPLPPGLAGQLFIGGEGVARGYLHQTGLTAERFVTLSQFPNAGRVYQTGDLVRYRKDGNLEYIGRIDQQVKIRGFRIELEEIESVLLKHTDIAQAVVVAHQDDVLGSSLAAYLVARNTTPSSAELVAFQRRFLPDYMVASKVQILDCLPLTPSGKVDRKLLSGMRMKSVGTDPGHAEPLTEVERELTQIWAKNFKNKSIGINDDFFALGGQSLLALQIFSEIERKMKVSLMLSLLLKAPTIRLLAAEITQRSA